MNVAMIIAGGSGQRMGQDIPKQFLNVYDKPVIIYTLEAFQKHPDIDAIKVVCLEGWEGILDAYAKQFNITKMLPVTTGGENGQASARNGVFSLREVCKSEDIVIIHDGIRPLVTPEIISDCIAKCRKYGNAVAAMPCAETILRTENRVNSHSSISRDEIMRVQTPQAYRFQEIFDAHQEALRRGITDAVYANTMIVELGGIIYFSVGSDRNMKITTIEDLEIFKALLDTKKAGWIK